jgi:RHS repeat-associated protein
MSRGLEGDFSPPPRAGFRAWLMGIPTIWSNYLFNLFSVLLPLVFFLPAVVSRKNPSSVIGLLSSRQRRLRRRCLCALIAYIMFISPEGFYQLSHAVVDPDMNNKAVFYTYDDNGSLTSKTLVDISSQNTLEVVVYEYNLQNRLYKTVTTPYQNGQPQTQDAVTVTYRYNPDGIRDKKTVDGTATNYQIDSYNHTGYAQVFRERTGSNTTAYAIGADVLAQAVNTGSPKYLLYDGHGSAALTTGGTVRQIADSDGAVPNGQSHYYDAYGGFLSWSDEPTSNLRYTGQYFDADAQQYYLRARWYNPSNGLFNRIDPYSGSYSDPQSLHKYLYCHANPINATDPSGLMEFSLQGMFITAVITGLMTGLMAGVYTAAVERSFQRGLDAFVEWYWIGFGVGAAVYGGMWGIQYLWFLITGGGAITAQQAAQKGFESPDQLRQAWRELGYPSDYVIHHFVQQTTQNISQFGKQAVHSILNSWPVDPKVHKVITQYQMSSPSTVGLNPAKYESVSHMYEYIQRLSWEEQYQWAVSLYEYIVQNRTWQGFKPLI